MNVAPFDMAIDRRDALKKLAVGGGTVVVGSAVISSPAFAFDAPTPPAEPDINTGGTGQFRLRYRPGTPTCNASATGGGSVVASDIEAASDNPNVTVTPASDSTTGDTFLDVVITPDTPPPGEAVLVTIDYRVRYRCEYPGGTSEICRSWFTNWVNTGTGWTSTIVATTSDCPA